MNLIKKIGKLSAIYSVARLFQKMLAFFLLPLYTRFLTPEDYGILSTVNSTTQFLILFFTFSINGAMFRYYWEYKDNNEQLREFFGTAFTFIFCSSILFTFLFVVSGTVLFKPVLNDIKFFPYMFLGIITLVFMPYFEIYLTFMQVRQEAGKYGVVSTIRLLITISLTIFFVVVLKLRVKGILYANLIAAILFFIVSFFEMSKFIRIGINKNYLKQMLRYSLPIIPHNISGNVKGVIDRAFINNMVGAYYNGFYHIGSQFGLILMFIADSVNRAIKPIFMEAMTKKDDKVLGELENIGVIFAYFLCVSAMIVSIFAKEIIIVITARAFHDSYEVIPYLLFNSVLQGYYFIFVLNLSYNHYTIKYISIISSVGILLNVAFNYYLILWYGYIGAAAATIITKFLSVAVLYLIGKRHSSLNWNVRVMFLMFFLSLTISLFFTYVTMVEYSLPIIILIKFISAFLMIIFIDIIIWKRPFKSIFLLSNIFKN